MKSKNPEKRRELLYAGISFFLVNFVVVLISTLIQLIVKNERVSADILSILQTFLIPFSLGNFILLSAISNINESRLDRKIILRFILTTFAFLAIFSLFYFLSAFFVESFKYIYPIFNLLLFSLFLFIYPFVFIGGSFPGSISKGIRFFLKNFQYALLLGIIYLFTNLSGLDLIESVIVNCFKIPIRDYLLSILRVKILPQQISFSKLP